MLLPIALPVETISILNFICCGYFYFSEILSVETRHFVTTASTFGTVKIIDAVTGCSLWTRKLNTAAHNGIFYGLMSESDCMTVCLTIQRCVAIDLWHYGCVIHNNVDDLKTAYNASGATQFVLNRHCLPTTPQLTTGISTVAAENFTETIGIIIITEC